MSFARRYLMMLLMTAGLGLSGMNAEAVVNVQCPGDPDGNGTSNIPGTVCVHLAGSDGFMRVADGRPGNPSSESGLYIFGFSNLTGRPIASSLAWGTFGAQFAAPTLSFNEGDKVYITLSNPGTVNRPDLFDPHSVHWHGFQNQGPVYDGEPDGSISINPGSSLTYYYEPVEAGTFMYHCHVEATEHMQLGMLGNLYVRPRQNNLPNETQLGPHTHLTGHRYVYNDGDGTTRYDVEFPVQISSMDPAFHDASNAVQPLPFANMKDTYPMLNGRGYPDTVNPNPLPPPIEKIAAGYLSANISSNPVSTRIMATSGQRILLRISNLSITNFYTLSTMGLTMRVVGMGAHILKGPSGLPAYYDTSSVTLGGGEAVDVIIDTTGVPNGRYPLYTTNLNYLSNNTEDFGGMMTEIYIGTNPPL
jgi:FtsP/CotA-like multicopper oxidase with cupredoxin domain